MGFRNNAFATVWQVEEGKGNFTVVRLTISRKNAEGAYEQEFSGRCMFISTARAKAEKLKERDRICLTSVDVSNKWDAANQRELVNYKVFDFEMADHVHSPSAAPAKKTPAPAVTEEDDEEAPF